MDSKRATQDPDKAYLTTLVGSYLVGRFDKEHIYQSKTKPEIVKRLALIGLSIWSLASTLMIILEFLDTDEGDSLLRDHGTYDGWWWPMV